MKRLCVLLEIFANVLRNTLIGLEKEHFSPKNVVPEFFPAIGDLKFQDVLSAVTNSGVPAKISLYSVQKNISPCKEVAGC